MHSFRQQGNVCFFSLKLQWLCEGTVCLLLWLKAFLDVILILIFCISFRLFFTVTLHNDDRSLSLYRSSNYSCSSRCLAIKCSETFLVKTRSQTHLASLALYLWFHPHLPELSVNFPQLPSQVLATGTSKRENIHIKQANSCFDNVRWSCWLLMTSICSQTFIDLLMFSSKPLLPLKREQSPCAPLSIVTPGVVSAPSE